MVGGTSYRFGLRGEPARIRGDDAGAANGHLALDQRDDDRGIFLRHAQGIATNVLVDDQVAHDHDAQISEARRELSEVDDPEAV
jgi:hypothetical protein